MASTPSVSRSSSRSSFARSISSRVFGNEDKSEDPPSFLDDPVIGPEILSLLTANLDKISDDEIIKLTRQLEFWYSRRDNLSDGEIIALTNQLIETGTWVHKLLDNDEKSDFKVPTTRFGRTEIKMPIITCGGMRIQDTWIPDNIGLLSANKKKVLKSESQQNLKDVIRACLKVGLNHFETARYYGTSEMQFVEALSSLIDSGEIKRSDFILQTKIFPPEKLSDFEKLWNESWDHIKDKLHYVDLFAFHCVSTPSQVKTVLDDSDDSQMAFVQKLKKEGKILHIGFSTHGPADNIMELISSNKFDYVNIHYHYMGSYHAEGTPDTVGGHGNLACVKKALELDMGVFSISPFDKGGKLYQPSKIVAETIGTKLTPISFAALHNWKTVGMHTISVGFARPSDLCEVLQAAKMYVAGKEFEEELYRAENRLKDLMVSKVGKEWHEEGLLNVPSMFEKSVDGIAIGHILWLHNLLTAYGMYDCCKERYASLESTGKAWKKDKPFEENIKKMNPGNPGREYDQKTNLTDALSQHYNPELVIEKVKECHSWLSKNSPVPTDEERKERGWCAAYSLTPWVEFPGELDTTKILLHRFMGPRSTRSSRRRSSAEAQSLRSSLRRASTTSLDNSDTEESPQ